jgi:outer membrane protein assembly factor BamB
MSEPTRPKLSRRLALLLPLAAVGCDYLEQNFTETPKPKLPGVRINLADTSRSLFIDNPRNLKVTLPAPSARETWALPGGSASHEGGHPVAGDKLTEVWHASFGTSAGYRNKIPSQPVVADGRVVVMDPAGLVTSFDVTSGKRIWEFDTTPEDSRSTNIGGGVSINAGTVYVSTGRAELLALNAATGEVTWRVALAEPARSAPTVADGRVFVAMLGNVIAAFAVADGKRIWSYTGTDSVTSMLGMPAPAYADGILVAGTNSGELVALRAATGAALWNDNLASARGRLAATGVSAIHGMPVIQNGRVYAISMGGLMLALDLRSGRRLWEREAPGQDMPWVVGEWLFVLSAESQLAAVNREDGSVAWLTQLPRFENVEKKRNPIFWSGPILAGERLIVVSGSGIAQALSPYTGEIIGEQELSGPASVAPVVAQGTVFVITDSARLVALR